MANTEMISGINTYPLFGAESAYGTAVATTSIFGGLMQNCSFSVDRQIQERAGFVGTNAYDGRATAQMVPGTVSTRASFEFDVQRFDWLEYLLLGTKTGSGTVAAPYVYSTGSTRKSITIAENIDNVTTDSYRVYAGMVLNSATIRCSVGQPVSANLELIGGKIAKTTTVTAKVAQLSDEVYNFSGGTIEMPDATSIGNVIDSVEISWSNNFEPLYGFNQESVNARPGKINASIKFTLKYLDDDQMTRLMGSATAITSQTAVTLGLRFTRGTNQYVDFVFTGVVISKIDDQHNLNEFMIEDVENLARYLTVTEAQS